MFAGRNPRPFKSVRPPGARQLNIYQGPRRPGVLSHVVVQDPLPRSRRRVPAAEPALAVRAAFFLVTDLEVILLAKPIAIAAGADR